MKVVLFCFGGWGQSDSGGNLDPDGKGGTAQLLKEIRSTLKAAKHDLRMFARSGAPQVDLNRCIAFLNKEFDETATLLVHGYSMGGFNALQVSYAFMLRGWHTKLKRVVETRGATYKDVTPLSVTMMTTVDIARGPTSDGASRRVWSSVAANHNIYQTNPSPISSRGGPTVAASPKTTSVKNEDWTSRYTKDPDGAHRAIDEDAVKPCLTTIKTALGIK